MSNYNSLINDLTYIQNIEKSVICSMFFSYDEIDNVFEILKPHMFLLPIHQIIVATIERLFIEELPIDENFILSRCEDKYKNSIEENLLNIFSLTPISDVSSYCKEILEAYKRRECDRLIKTLSKALMQDNLASDDILSLASSEIDKIENLHLASSNVESLEKKALRFEKEPPLKQIKTGIQWLDSPKCLNGGFACPNFIFLSGEKESGKTYLATTILENMANNGEKVGFFPLEFGAKAYWEGIKQKYPHKDNQKRINCMKNIYIEDGVTDILDIAKKIKKMHKMGVHFIFIDSKLRLTHKNFKGGTLAHMLSEIFAILGTLTMQLEIAIMLVVQMPKENYTNNKLSVKDCVDADHEAKVWINIKIEEKTGFREITMGKNKQNYKRLRVRVKFDPINHSFIKIKDLLEEEDNGKKKKKIGESDGIPIYQEENSDDNNELYIPDIL